MRGAKIHRLSATDGVFDFRSVSRFGRSYLKTYYCQPPTADERVVLSFLARQLWRLRGATSFIEIGCGPTVHHVLPVAPFVEEIVLADYLPENLHEVQLWLDEEKDAHCWREYTQLALHLEGGGVTEESISERERILRGKVSGLTHCNLLNDEPLEESPSFRSRRFTAVGCFYVTEEIGTTKETWGEVMARLGRLVAPGGTLLFSALRKTEFYLVEGPNGEQYHYPCAYLEESDVAHLLPQLGFESANTIIEGKAVEGQEEAGVNGVILVAATKKNSVEAV